MRYKFSFTAGALMLEESKKVAKVYQQERDWKLTKQKILEKNLLQKIRITTTKRQLHEVVLRISKLDDKAIELISKGDNTQARNILYYSILKTYRFILEFVSEVMYEKFMNLDYEVLNLDYDKFYTRKSNKSEKLRNLSDSTKYKIKQVMFKIFAEAEIIDSTRSKKITKPFLSKRVGSLIYNDNPQYLRCFLLTDKEISNLMG